MTYVEEGGEKTVGSDIFKNTWFGENVPSPMMYHETLI